MQLELKNRIIGQQKKHNVAVPNDYIIQQIPVILRHEILSSKTNYGVGLLERSLCYLCCYHCNLLR